ncbi:MAG: hypothetical protein OXG37_04565 [Actinomycetia bacterium]|nr:hypothetical protein [Actinomycetes bacterium]
MTTFQDAVPDNATDATKRVARAISDSTPVEVQAAVAVAAELAALRAGGCCRPQDESS